MKTIVFVTGVKGSGKDTFVDFIQQKIQLRSPCVKLAYADALREICTILFGFTNEHYENRDFKENGYINGYNPRGMLQFIGTDLFRKHFDKDIWVKILTRRIRDQPDGSYIFVSDVRFENEIDLLQEFLGNENIQYTHVLITRNTCMIEDHHPSELFSIRESIEETRTRTYNYIISNDTTLQDFLEKCNVVDL